MQDLVNKILAVFDAIKDGPSVFDVTPNKANVVELNHFKFVIKLIRDG